MNIKKNTAINIAGSIVQIGVTLAIVPLYLGHIGESRYGILAIVWLLLGYLSLLDLGLSRATANQIAKLKDDSAEKREQVFWTALLLNLLLGVLGGGILYGLGGIVFGSLFKIQSELRPEILGALPWLCVAVPVATTSSVMTGALEGRGRFATVNIIQVAGTVLFQTVPLVVAYMHGPDLAWLIPAAVCSRLASNLLMFGATYRLVPLSRPMLPSPSWFRTLFSYGAWVAISNLISPILEVLDRFLIGAILGVKAVTYYTVPYNLAVRINILPAAVSRTLFPVLSFENGDSARELSARSVRGLAAIMTPIVVIAILLIRPFLTLWVGLEMSDKSATVGEVLLLGIWINCLAFIPYAQLQGQARPDLTAKFHLAELLPFIGVLWLGLKYFGLVGGAAAWVFRVTLDTSLLFWASGLRWDTIRFVLFGACAMTASALVAWITPLPSVTGVLLGFAVAAGSAYWAWRSEPRIGDAMRRVLKWRTGKMPDQGRRL